MYYLFYDSSPNWLTSDYCICSILASSKAILIIFIVNVIVIFK